MNPTPSQIRETRQAAGLTQQQAADLIGVVLRTWAYWESGDYNMRSQSWELFKIRLKERKDEL